MFYRTILGFSGGASGKKPTCQCRRHKRHRFSPWVGMISWKRTWQPTPVFFLENPMDRRTWQSMVHSGSQRVRHNWNNLAYTHEATTANIILEPWRDESIVSKIRSKTRMSTIATVIQHSIGSPSKSDQTRKRFVVVQSLSYLKIFKTPWTVASQALLSSSVSWSLLKVPLIELVKLSNHLILYHPFLLLPSIFPSIRVFSNESILIRWSKYWSFSFSISSSSKYSGLISFRMDWFDLLAVQGTFKSLLQHHSSNVSIFWHSAFFMV